MAETISPPTPASTRARRPNAGQKWQRVILNDDAPGLVVTHGDGDRYVMTREVIEWASKYGYRYNEFVKQFGDLTDILGDWIASHSADVQEAYVTRKNDGFLFVVVQREKPLNISLEDDLIDLDIRVAQNGAFDLVGLSVMLLPPGPNESIAGFLSPTATMVYANAQREGTPEPCES